MAGSLTAEASHQPDFRFSKSLTEKAEVEVVDLLWFKVSELSAHGHLIHSSDVMALAVFGGESCGFRGK